RLPGVEHDASLPARPETLRDRRVAQLHEVALPLAGEVDGHGPVSRVAGPMRRALLRDLPGATPELCPGLPAAVVSRQAPGRLPQPPDPRQGAFLNHRIPGG